MKKKCKYANVEKIILLIISTCLLGLTFIIILTVLNSLKISFETINSTVAIVAVIISVASIFYTEYSRKKQNSYEYQKNKVEIKIEKLNHILYEEIDNLKKACMFNMPVKFSTPEENVDFLLNKVFSNKAVLVASQSKIRWQYNDEQFKKAKVLQEFMEEYNVKLSEIDNELSNIVNILSNTINKLNESTLSGKITEGWVDIDIVKEMQAELLKSFEKLITYSQITIETLYSKAKDVLVEYESILLSNVEM